MTSRRAKHEATGGLLLAKTAWPWFCVLAATVPALGQAPAARMDVLFPPGCRAGASVEVHITVGQHLETMRALAFSHPGITAESRSHPGIGSVPNPKNKKQVLIDPKGLPFTVNVAPDVPPGLYEVRAVGSHGLSNARTFAVGDLPEVGETADNHTLEGAQTIAVDSVVNGTAEREKIDFFKFDASAGRRILIDCMSERLDSKMDATLVVQGPGGRPLANSRDVHGRDPMIDFVATEDGQHVVKVYDVIYDGGHEHYYRLAVTSRPHVDFVFPPAGYPGTSSRFTIYGRNLPGSTPAPQVMMQGSVLEKLEVQISIPHLVYPDPTPLTPVCTPAMSSSDALTYRHMSPQGASNPVLVGYATAPVTLEQEPNDEAAAAPKVDAPCEVAGWFAADRPDDRDWYRFEARKDQTFCVEVTSHRLGLPTDPFLLVQQMTEGADGKPVFKDIVNADDPPAGKKPVGDDVLTRDPSCRFTAPSDGTYLVLVQNRATAERGDLVYRLAIRAPQPGFHLVARPYPTDTPRSLLLRPGGGDVVQVTAYRRDGFDGPIELGCRFLPTGVRTTKGVIRSGERSGFLILRAAPDAPSWVGPLQFTGTATIGQTRVTRVARSAQPRNDGKLLRPPWKSSPVNRVSGQTMLAVLDGWEFPIDLQRADPTDGTNGKPLSTSLGGTVQVPVKLRRRKEGFGGGASATVEPTPEHLKVTAAGFGGETTEASISLKFNSGFPHGVHDFILHTEASIPFAANREATAALAALDLNQKIATDAAEAAKYATEAGEAAATWLKEADDARIAAEEQKKKIEAAAKLSAEQLTAATAKLKEAKRAAEGADDDEAAVKALEAAGQAASEFKEADVAAREAVAAAAKALDEAQKKYKTAQDRKVKAAAEAERTKTLSEAAAKAKEAAEQFSKLAAILKDVNVRVPFAVTRVDVKPAPIALEFEAPASPLNQSGETEVVLTLERLFGFDDEVNLSLIVPEGVKGLDLSQPAIKIAKDGSTATLTIRALPNATPGTHDLKIEARMKFGKQDVKLEQPFKLTVAIDDAVAPDPASGG